jgi:hypothetical protein
MSQGLTGSTSASIERIAQFRKLLRAGPMSSEALQKALDISQPTLSRTIHNNAQEVIAFRVSGVRTPQYGLLRHLPKVPSAQNLYRITELGDVEESGTFMLLSGGGTYVNTKHGGGRLYVGLPPAMTFAAPAGFMGQAIAAEVSKRLDVPPSLGNWSDDHRVMYLATSAPDAPGNYVFGNVSLASMMEQRKLKPVSKMEKLAQYVKHANSATQLGFGSSAGGEQPKFTCELDEIGHVIVKFAKTGSRTAELLLMEHLALSTLTDCALSAAKSECLEHGGITFLEVQRFDRMGRFGRRGMISAGSLDDELFACRDSWSEFAVRCLEARMITPAVADQIHTMAAYGSLIGNTDMHFENIALMLDEAESPVAMAPAYDMLPMQYASVGTMDPPLVPIAPALGSIGGRSVVWRHAFEAASIFWGRVAKAPALSEAMRAVAMENMGVVRQFVAPLIAATQGEKGEKRGRNPLFKPRLPRG